MQRKIAFIRQDVDHYNCYYMSQKLEQRKKKQEEPQLTNYRHKMQTLSVESISKYKHIDKSTSEIMMKTNKSMRIQQNKKQEGNHKKVLVLYFSGSAGANLNLQIEKDYLKDKIKENQYLYDYKIKMQQSGDEQFLVTPELATGSRIYYKIYQFQKISHSINVTIENIKEVAIKIMQNYKKYDAFIVLCGFDVICYIATLISFMLENLSKLVIFTGGYFPISFMRNDIVSHLIQSFSLISMASNFHDVIIVCNYKGFRANRSIKMNQGELNAMSSPNLTPLVSINIKIKFREYLFLPIPKEQFSIWTDLSCKVGILKYHTLLTKEAIQYDLNNPCCDGFVIQSYGSSNLPVNPDILNIFKKIALEKNKIFVNACHSVKKVNKSVMKQYLQGFYIYYGGDMTTEAALAKLSYLLSKKYPREEIKKLLETNLRGQLTEIKKENQFSAESLSFMQLVRFSIQEYYPSNKFNLFLEKIQDEIVSSIKEETTSKQIQQWFYPIKEDPDLQESTYQGRLIDIINRNNLLHKAVILKNENLYKYFLHFEIDINKEDENNCSPLYYAIVNQDKIAIQYLIRKDCKILCLEDDLFQVIIKELMKDNLSFFELLYHIEFKQTLRGLINQQARNVLHLSVILKADKCGKYLIDKFRLDTKAKDIYGKSCDEYNKSRL